MIRILAGLLALMLAALACGMGTPPLSTLEPAFVPSIPVSGLQLSIAGLIPRNYPNPSSDDWNDLFTHLHETGNLVGVYTAWSDSLETKGQPPKVIKTAFDLQKQYGIALVIAFSFCQDTAEDHLAPLIRWDDAGQRERAVETARQIAESYQPPYLALGIEINRYYEEDPAGFESYANLYAGMCGAIKVVSSQTLVFPIFQYEKMRGGVFFSGDNQAQPEWEWELLDKFNGRMDLMAFTTYPFLFYADSVRLAE